MMEQRTERFEGRFLRFSVALLSIAKEMPRGPIVRHVADQLFRSASSAGANVTEAQSAQSSADFVSKMEIALKEIRETGYWLMIASDGNLLDKDRLLWASEECEELTAILAKSVITAKAKRRR